MSDQLRERYDRETDGGKDITFSEWLEAALDAAERRIRQLTEALTAIAEGKRPDNGDTWHSGKSWRIELAREALASEPAPAQYEEDLVPDVPEKRTRVQAKVKPAPAQPTIADAIYGASTTTNPPAPAQEHQ